MDEFTNALPATYLPATEKDLYTYKNRETGKIEQIDLRTGKMYESYVPMKQNEFCNQTADLICQEIMQGTSLRETLATYRIPSPVFYKWLAIFPEFHKRYTEARKQRADYHFHRAVELADGAVGMAKDFIPGLKVAVDTHKWAAEKSDPERFAKPKDEGGMVGNITINLQTGVLDKQAPKDIVVDQYGNFEGFGVILEEHTEETESTSELKTDRWGVYDGEEEIVPESSEEISGTES